MTEISWCHDFSFDVNLKQGNIKGNEKLLPQREYRLQGILCICQSLYFQKTTFL